MKLEKIDTPLKLDGQEIALTWGYVIGHYTDSLVVYHWTSEKEPYYYSRFAIGHIQEGRLLTDDGTDSGLHYDKRREEFTDDEGRKCFTFGIYQLGWANLPDDSDFDYSDCEPDEFYLEDYID